jgi:inhibitor of KinA
MVEYRVLTAGDAAIVVEFGDNIDRGLNAIVLALARRLDESAIAGLHETIPTFRSLTIFYEPAVLSKAALEARIAAIVHELETTQGRGHPLWSSVFGGCRYVTTRTWRLISTRSPREPA